MCASENVSLGIEPAEVHPSGGAFPVLSDRSHSNLR